MRIAHRLKPLIAPREGQLLAFVGCAGPNDADNGNQAVNLIHVAHPAKAGHGRALDVVDGASIAAGDHLPDYRVSPRFKGIEVEGRGSLILNPNLSLTLNLFRFFLIRIKRKRKRKIRIGTTI